MTRVLVELEKYLAKSVQNFSTYTRVYTVDLICITGLIVPGVARHLVETVL
jgi:hypothetical protein